MKRAVILSIVFALILTIAAPFAVALDTQHSIQKALVSKSANAHAFQVAQAKEVTVYITKTGKKYHKGNCRYLKQSKIAIKLSDAKKRGYTPCKVCKPPK